MPTTCGSTASTIRAASPIAAGLAMVRPSEVAPPAISGAPVEAGRLDEQHHGGDQVEDRELDLGEELHAGGAHEADDQRADQGALEAAEAADHDHDEGEH